MKTVKKPLSLVLSAILALTALRVSALAAGPFTEIGTDPATFPEFYDLRDVEGVSYVTPVKLQNPFGTCWGFAAIASAETSILSSGLAAEMGYTVDTLDLSEKHLAYFVNQTIDDEDDPQCGEGMSHFFEEGDDPVTAALDSGGMPMFATGLFASGTGPVLEDANEQFLYRGRNGTVYQVTREDGTVLDYCYSADDDWSIDGDLRWTQNFVLKESYIVDVSHYDGEETEDDWRATVNAIKDLIHSGHAVEVAFCADVSMPGQDPTTQYINENWAHYTFEEAPANHAVAIIGWDDRYPRENFAHKTQGWIANDDESVFTLGEIDAPIPEHDGAWLVKNSWGSGEEEFPNNGGGGWGLLQGQDKGVYNEETGKYEYNAIENAVHTGYFWLSYEDHSLLIPEALDFDLVTAQEGYYIAEYDYMPVNSIWVEQHGEKVQMANIFTVDADVPSVSLDYVSCLTGAANAKVTYDVYLLSDGGAAPTDGTRVSGATAEYRYGGFHKVPLDTPVKLRGGQRFAVVVTQETEEDGEPCYSFNIQAALSEYGAIKYESPLYAAGIVNPGESMFLLNGEWIDLTDPLARAALLKEPLDPKRQAAVLDNFPIKAYLTPYDTTVPGFTDVTRDAWYADAVAWAARRGAVSADAEGRFDPDAVCTRAQMVELLWRAAGRPEPLDPGEPFADVTESDSFRKAVLWAAEHGIATGTAPGRFDPDAPVDRAQMAAFLYRFEQARGGGFTGAWAFPLRYADASEVPEWAYEPFCWLTMNGIVDGIDGSLLPGAGCLRSQAVAMLYRYFNA